MRATVQGGPVTSSHIVWYDLLAHDPDEVAPFLADLLSWKSVTTSGPNGRPYHTLHVAAGTVAAILGMTDTTVGPHWVPHFRVDDVAATVKRLLFLQGSVLEQATAVEGLGTVALGVDPGGVALAAFAPLAPDEVGGPAWATLLAPRIDLGGRAYRALFGWSEDRAIPTPAGRYGVMTHKGAPVAGLLDPRDLGTEPQWVPHATVPDLDAALERATTFHAEVVLPPTEVAGVGHLAIVVSPEGLPMGLRAA